MPDPGLKNDAGGLLATLFRFKEVELKIGGTEIVVGEDIFAGKTAHSLLFYRRSCPVLF
jgi:hypothetical protein